MAKPLPIDPKLVQDLAAIGCKTTEIATIVGCSVDTLDRRFAEEMEKGRSNLRASLRRWQLESAKKGNVAMLIWLGKQILQQSDKIEQVAHLEVKQLTPGEIDKIMATDPFVLPAKNESGTS
jgi:hypothetical protein